MFYGMFSLVFHPATPVKEPYIYSDTSVQNFPHEE